VGIYVQLEGNDEILNDFVAETNELIDQLGEDLQGLGNGNDDELIDRALNAYRKIKGTSEFLNFEKCNSLANAAEEVLNTIRGKKLTTTPQVIGVLLETVNWFKEFVTAIQQREENNYDIQELVTVIENILREDGADSNTKTDTSSSNSNTESGNVVFELSKFPERLVQEFITESLELLDTLNSDLLSLEKSEAVNEGIIDNIFRAFHTLKGNGGILGLTKMSMVAHKSEDVLNLIREKRLIPSSDAIDVLLSSVDWLENFIEEIQKNGTANQSSAGIIEQLSGVITIMESSTNEQMVLHGGKKFGNVPYNSLKKINQTIRVNVKRLDTLLDLTNELVAGKNRLFHVCDELNRISARTKEIEKLNRVNKDLGVVIDEIHRSIIDMRMLPISYVFRKFHHLVRNLAREKGKEIEFLISGEDTELDRSVIESISDPLVHLLRNAVDHGIEKPKIRRKNGKPTKGTISLSVFQEKNQIIIEVKDDGAGIDYELVRRKAVEKKILTEEEARKLPLNDLINLIFRPGFSTAKQITDISGRGVGMDVVRSNIAKLNGTIDVKTEPGAGSAFTIKLPLTSTLMAARRALIF